MISITGKKWVQQKINKNLAEKVKQDYELTNFLSNFVVSRNYDATEIFSINNYQKLSNLFINDFDFQKASSIFIDSIKKKENICILGDYDVDGSCATSLLVRYLTHINQPHFFYIPDRVVDGYGASKKLFQKLILKKPKLVIMVDCGSNSNNAVDFLRQNNIKSIIIDHHEINSPYPKSNALINPKKNFIKKEHTILCATTLTYFLLDILIKKNKSKFKLSKFLIYVLLATICDVMPLRKINKIIAINTIKDFNIKDNAAIEFIFNQFDIKKKISIEDLGFLIGPIINAGGRLNYSNYGVELLSSDNQEIIKKKSINLINLNNKRKKIEQNILNNLDYEKIRKENNNIIIYQDNNIHEGLIGIIAARLKEYFNKPSIVITKSNDYLKASARSTSSYNVGYLIKLLIDKKIIENGGGHNLAAGFSFKKRNIDLLRNFIEKDFLKKNINFDNSIKYDSEISISAINSQFLREISKLEPFGNKNSLPIFLIKNVKIIKSETIKNKHISVIVKPSIGPSIKSICFNSVNSKLGEYLLSYKKEINLIAEIHQNFWNNKKSIQLNIKDLIL